MAGMDAIVIGLIGFAAGVVFGNSVRSALEGVLPEGVTIPSFYTESAYPASAQKIEYDTTRSAFAGSVYEKDYDNEMETHINHLPMGD